jgi:hypothetical protein
MAPVFTLPVMACVAACGHGQRAARGSTDEAMPWIAASSEICREHCTKCGCAARWTRLEAVQTNAGCTAFEHDVVAPSNRVQNDVLRLLAGLWRPDADKSKLIVVVVSPARQVRNQRCQSDSRLVLEQEVVTQAVGCRPVHESGDEEVVSARGGHHDFIPVSRSGTGHADDRSQREAEAPRAKGSLPPRTSGRSRRRAAHVPAYGSDCSSRRPRRQRSRESGHENHARRAAVRS